MANTLFTKITNPLGGATAPVYKPSTSGYINVTSDYTWTLSQNGNIRESAPRVILKEFQIDESALKRTAYAYSTTVTSAFSKDELAVYEHLFEKTNPTGFVYDFPYFNDVNFEIKTPAWRSLDVLGGAGDVVKGAAGLKGGKTGALVQGAVDFGPDLTKGLLQSFYSSVGVTDRPRMWFGTEPRTISIKFSLFNTFDATDWEKNYWLCKLLVYQNLFNKLDGATQFPPVFYELIVIGQHYSWASCVTNLTIRNRGNMRLLQTTEGIVVNVPDAYEVNITLVDMVMPSRNQFHAIKNNKVFSDITTTTATVKTLGENIQNSTIFRKINNETDKGYYIAPIGTPGSSGF